MKKKCLVLLLVPFAFSSLTSCSSSKESLTFGTYVNQTLQSLEVLSDSQLINKADSNETFLLAVYQGGYSETCDCWITFQNIITSYMNKYNERVYVYDAQGQDGTTAHLKIEKINESSPSLYIFSGNTQLAKFTENRNKDKGIFTDTTCESMHKRIHKVVNKPKAYYVDDNYLKENLANSSKTIISFVRRKCGDCNYVIPNVIIPYINSKNIKANMWLFDMQDLYDLSNAETASEEEKKIYQGVKDRYGLSTTGNETYGYQKGVVPTTQYYENGILKDASVFFNETVEQREDESYFISDSYYSEERLQNLHYLKDVNFTTCLKGMELQNTSVLHNQSGKPYWSQSNAAKYHTPLLKAFLDYYA